MIIQIKRVPYGKEATPEELREYTIVGSESTAVGTKDEIENYFMMRNRGRPLTLEVIE